MGVMKFRINGFWKDAKERKTQIGNPITTIAYSCPGCDVYCSTGCGGQCLGNCNDACTRQCTGCEGQCFGRCNDTCWSTCANACDNCTGKCNGCNGCTNTCLKSCTAANSGNGGCTECGGTCGVTCESGGNNADQTAQGELNGSSDPNSTSSLKGIENGKVNDTCTKYQLNSLPRVYIGGTWKEVTSAKTCIDGTWKTISATEIQEIHTYTKPN